MNYSRTLMTDEAYLPMPLPGWRRDPARSALATYGAIAAHAVQGAAELLPMTFMATPDAAISAYMAHRHLLADGNDGDARRTLCRMAEEWVRAEDRPMLGALRQALEGQELEDGRSTEPAPQVLMQTVRHAPNLLGEYKTYRHHMRITQSLAEHGTPTDARARRAARLAGGTVEPITEGTFVLLRQANDMLKGDPWVVRGLIQPTSIIGTEDMATPQGITYRPDRVGAIADGYYTRDEHGNILPMLAKPRVAVGSQTRPNGGLRKSTPLARHPRPGYRKAGQVVGTVGNWGWSVDPRGQVEPCSLIRGPFTSTSPVIGYTTTYDGATIVGRGHWTRPVRKTTRPTTRAARQLITATKVKPVQTTIAEAPNAAQALALSLTQGQPRTTDHDLSETPGTTARQADSFKLALPDGRQVTVSKGIGKPFRVTIKDPDGTRKSTNVTAPAYVAAALRNRL